MVRHMINILFSLLYFNFSTFAQLGAISTTPVVSTTSLESLTAVTPARSETTSISETSATAATPAISVTTITINTDATPTTPATAITRTISLTNVSPIISSTVVVTTTKATATSPATTVTTITSGTAATGATPARLITTVTTSTPISSTTSSPPSTPPVSPTPSTSGVSSTTGPTDKASATQTISPALSSGVLSDLSGISVISNFLDTRADAKFTFTTSLSTFRIGLSQSFQKKPSNLNLLDLNGIPQGTQLSLFGQTAFGIKPLLTPPIRNVAAFTNVTEEFKRENNLPSNQDITFDDLSPKYKAKLFKYGIATFQTPWFLSYGLNIGKIHFDYIDNTTSTNYKSTDEVSGKVTFSLSKFITFSSYFSASYSLESTYKSGNETLTYTFPVGSNGVTTTKEVTVGEPINQSGSVLKVEFRSIIFNKLGDVILGMNPSISAYFSREKINFDLPIYFLTKNDNGDFNNLQLGIKIGYTDIYTNSFIRNLFESNTNKLYFSLFISQPFSLK